MNSSRVRHLHQTTATFQLAKLHISKAIAVTWPAAGAYDRPFSSLGNDFVVSVSRYVTATIEPFSTSSS